MSGKAGLTRAIVLHGDLGASLPVPRSPLPDRSQTEAPALSRQARRDLDVCRELLLDVQGLLTVLEAGVADLVDEHHVTPEVLASLLGVDVETLVDLAERGRT